MPARSRHCNSERICIVRHWERSWEGAEERWTEARRTAWLTITVWPASDGDGDLSIRDVWGGLFAIYGRCSHFYSGDNQLFSYAGRAFLIAFVLYCRKVFLPGNAWGEEVLIHFIQFYKIAVTMVCRGIAQRLRLWKVGAFSFQPLLAAWIIQADSFILHSLWKGSRYHAGCVSHKTLPIW